MASGGEHVPKKLSTESRVLRALDKPSAGNAMNYRTLLRYRGCLLVVVTAALLLVYPNHIMAQRGGGGQPQSAQETAAIDLTGYWISVVTEDWRVRMVTPPKGYYESLPLPTNSPAGPPPTATQITKR